MTLQQYWSNGKTVQDMIKAAYKRSAMQCGYCLQVVRYDDYIMIKLTIHADNSIYNRRQSSSWGEGVRPVVLPVITKQTATVHLLPC